MYVLKMSFSHHLLYITQQQFNRNEVKTWPLKHDDFFFFLRLYLAVELFLHIETLTCCMSKPLLSLTDKAHDLQLQNFDTTLK